MACQKEGLQIKKAVKEVSNVMFLSHFVRFRTVEYIKLQRNSINGSYRLANIEFFEDKRKIRDLSILISFLDNNLDKEILSALQNFAQMSLIFYRACN